MTAAFGEMFQRFAVGHHAGTGERVGEHRIHQFQHRGGGPERHVQPDLAEQLPGAANPRSQVIAGAAELRGVGTLEGVNRLLAVAHGEHGAQAVAGGQPGEEFLGQPVSDLPLQRAVSCTSSSSR